MKGSVCLLLLALVVVASSKQFYDEKFDKIKVEEIVNNPKLVKHFANCFLEKGPCNGLARDIREVMKDAMKNACDRCSPKQIQLMRSVTTAMRRQNPALFNQILDKFDPTKKLRVPFYIATSSVNENLKKKK